MSRGRPRCVNTSDYLELIKKCAPQIVINGAVAPKSNPIFEQISVALEARYQPHTVHSLILLNRHKELEILGLVRDQEMSNHTLPDLNEPEQSSLSLSANSEYDFSLNVTKEEFQSITYNVERFERTREGKQTRRQRLCFVPEKWQNFFTDKIWSQAKVRCGFCYQTHYITPTGGNFKGKLCFV